MNQDLGTAASEAYRDGGNSWSAAAEAVAERVLSLPYLHALVMQRYGLPAAAALRMADRIRRDLAGPQASGTAWEGAERGDGTAYAGSTGEFAELLAGWGMPASDALELAEDLTSARDSRTALRARLGDLRASGRAEFGHSDLEEFRAAHGRSLVWLYDALAELESAGEITRRPRAGAWAFPDQEAKTC